MLIVDYKTSRNVPRNVAEIPAYFHKQMQGYIEVLKILYPHHEIEAAILWTATAQLMPLTAVNAQAA